MRSATLIALMLLSPLALAEERRTATPVARVTATPTPGPRSLAEAARQIKLRSPERDSAGRIVISDRTLPELAEQGAVTTTTGERSADRRFVDIQGEGAPGSGSGEVDPEQRREFWRGKFQAQAAAIAVLEARIAELDREIPGLWNQFYAWDDPAYRDGVIKVRLDRALAESEELKAKLPAEREKLEEIREQARRDGALPGWFRDLE